MSMSVLFAYPPAVEAAANDTTAAREYEPSFGRTFGL